MGHNLVPGFYVLDHRDGSVYSGPFHSFGEAEKAAGMTPCCILRVTGGPGDVLPWLCGVPTCEPGPETLTGAHLALGRELSADVATVKEAEILLGEGRHVCSSEIPEPFEAPPTYKERASAPRRKPQPVEE